MTEEIGRQADRKELRRRQGFVLDVVPWNEITCNNGDINCP